MTSRERSHFSKRWLRYDPQQPTRPRLLRHFVMVVIGLLIACALLALIAGP